MKLKVGDLLKHIGIYKVIKISHYKGESEYQLMPINYDFMPLWRHEKIIRTQYKKLSEDEALAWMI